MHPTFVRAGGGGRASPENAFCERFVTEMALTELARFDGPPPTDGPAQRPAAAGAGASGVPVAVAESCGGNWVERK